MTGDLVAFLRARLDEDEQVARATTTHQPYDEWEALGNEGDDDIARSIWEVPMIARRWSNAPAARSIMEHIARHDPARVLAEVDAKRRILARHRPITATDDPAKPEWIGACDGCGIDSTGPWTKTMNNCPELRDLASVYRDHPDYQPEWAPEE